jgi:Dihydrodipicolinate synthase/N-acetylneuraminate lyase
VEISGVFPALTTPYRDDGSVATERFKENIARYNKIRLAGYVVLGSTGESVLLSGAEGELLLSAAKEVAANGKLMIAGTGAESTAETIAKCKRAAVLGYDLALVKTPYYYKPVYKPEVYLRHYRSVADASPIPVLLYSVPIFTGVTLETPEILALAQHPNIAGIKDSSGVIQRVVEVVAQAGKSFHVLTGGAGVIYPALAAGAKGAILALAAALPERCVAIYDDWKRGHHAAALAEQQQLALASKTIASENGIAGLKYAMDLRGYFGGVPRLPLLPLPDEKKQQIHKLVTELESAAVSA